MSNPVRKAEVPIIPGGTLHAWDPYRSTPTTVASNCLGHCDATAVHDVTTGLLLDFDRFGQLSWTEKAKKGVLPGPEGVES